MKYLLCNATLLLTLAGRIACQTVPVMGLDEWSLVAVASPTNAILYEVIDVVKFPPSKPVRIRSDAPVTIQRYNNVNFTEASNVYFDRAPLPPGKGAVLVTSDCDTSATDLIPSVAITSDEQNATIVTVTLGVDGIAASGMTFLTSSSYDVVFYSTEIRTAGVEPRVLNIKDAPCMTEETCREVSKERGFEFLYVGDYSTSGCFYKESDADKAYWSTRGDPTALKETLSGSRLPLYCKDDVEDLTGPSDDTCNTKDQCDKSRLELGIASILQGNFPTKGCFSKMDSDGTITAFWSEGGTADEMSRANLPGVQERIFCHGDSVTTTVAKCEIGPMASYTHSHCNDGQFCELEFGICNTNDGFGFFDGECAVKPDMCIEMYDPVCGCDNTTYGNSCMAAAEGVSVSRTGECHGEIVNTSQATFYLEVVTPDNSATISGFSIKSFFLGSVLANVVPSKPVMKIPAPRSRSLLDTCAYNVEVLLGGCFNDGIYDRTSAQIEVAAPKARVINSMMEVVDTEKVVQYPQSDFKVGTFYSKSIYKNTGFITFPDDQEQLIYVKGDAFASVPPVQEGICSQMARTTYK